MKVIVSISLFVVFSSFSAPQGNDCESYTYGGVRIVNNTKYLAEGRICLKQVDKTSGRIHPKFCKSFSINPGSDMVYQEVLEGNASYVYGVYKKDPNHFENKIYSDEKHGNVYIEKCKTAELILQ